MSHSMSDNDLAIPYDQFQRVHQEFHRPIYQPQNVYSDELMLGELEADDLYKDEDGN